MRAPTEPIYVKLMVSSCFVRALGRFTEEEEEEKEDGEIADLADSRIYCLRVF